MVNGQKVWTSMARKSEWGILLARTDPEATKHEGITYFLLDMKSEGIEIRPLREITGAAMFNEVFFTDVFIPDDCVVGAVNGGWRLARTTLANERVSMSSGATFGFGIEWMLGSLDSGPWAGDTVVLDEIGGLLAEAQSLALSGPGPRSGRSRGSNRDRRRRSASSSGPNTNSGSRSSASSSSAPKGPPPKATGPSGAGAFSPPGA